MGSLEQVSVFWNMRWNEIVVARPKYFYESVNARVFFNWRPQETACIAEGRSRYLLASETSEIMRPKI